MITVKFVNESHPIEVMIVMKSRRKADQRTTIGAERSLLRDQHTNV